MNKTQKLTLLLLAAFLCLLGAAWAFLGHLNEQEEQPAEQIQAFSLDPSQITEIELVSDKGTVTMVKENDAWQFSDEDEKQTDASAVDAILQKVADIRADKKIERVTDWEQYGLADPGISLTLRGKDTLSIIQIGDYNATAHCYYLRIGQEDTVYTVESSYYVTVHKSKEDLTLQETDGETNTNTETETGTDAETGAGSDS